MSTSRFTFRSVTNKIAHCLFVLLLLLSVSACAAAPPVPAAPTATPPVLPSIF